MLSSGLLESQTGKIEMEGVSEQSVKVFVSYLYQNKVEANQVTEQVAVDLLQMAHQYNIPNLERIMVDLMSTKPGGWFSSENALAIYLFAGKFEAYKLLTNKMLMVMKG